MPIRNLMKYDWNKNKLEKEGDIIDLLRDVRISINRLEYTFEVNALKEVLETIESGKHIIRSRATKDIEVDLSNAYEFVKEYKLMSEGGCRSCQYIGIFKAELGEASNYCELYEGKLDVDEKKGFSPRIKKYFKDGCEDKVPTFRSIEEVLSEMEG